MAGNKMNSKTKSKVNKSGNLPNEGTEDHDFALLRKPIQTSITGFAQARKIFDLATKELKDILTNECDLLYECKVCRNLFRSLANFISHKRVYCKEKFSTAIHGHFIKSTSINHEIMKINQLEEGYKESLKTKNDSDKINDDDERIPLTKDLTSIVEKITKNRGVADEVLDEVQQVSLQKIPSSSVAVFQSVSFDNSDQVDHIGSQVLEIDKILSQDKAVLQKDGKFTVERSKIVEVVTPKISDGVIQISDDETDGGSDCLKCKICNLQFATQKTLRFHTKYKHLESRLVYPCPDCVDIFSTSWSVYRHLFKVHRKTAAQIRRLRDSIQGKAFKMDNPPAFYEKRKNNMKASSDKKMSEEERLDQENQAWMDNMESDISSPRCGGCGRTFERRAALTAHTHTCQPRYRALQHRKERKIEIQIRKDYNKGQGGVLLNDNNGNKVTQDENSQPSITLQKETDKKVLEEATMSILENNGTSPDKESVADSPDKSNDSFTETPVNKSINKIPLADQNDKVCNNFNALKKKIQSRSDVDISNFACKKCDIKHVNLQELCDHMANHIKWMRYACKLCNFKNYLFEILTDHIKTVHKLKGDPEFYHSTIKVIDGNEALDLVEENEENNEENGPSPDSRRPSRCSSDSSRLSDDSSSSSARVESNSRKRKIDHSKGSTKKLKESPTKSKDYNEEPPKKRVISMEKVIKVIFGDTDLTGDPNTKGYDETSSDLDELDDKLSKKVSSSDSVAVRRPVRKRTIPKNKDFEYDLSNLLKMEAQGYRDSQSGVTTKAAQNKKKPQPENAPVVDINKDFPLALLNMSRKSVEIAAAHIKPRDMSVFNSQKEVRICYPFVKPMLPKTQLKLDKESPKKVSIDEKDSSNKNENSSNCLSQSEQTCNPDSEPKTNLSNEEEVNHEKDPNPKLEKSLGTDTSQERDKPNTSQSDLISAMVPLKFRRQSLEVMKNPLVNKNIKDLSKAGMKTKILVIKPINRNKDGTQAMSSALKFQTIKLKDPSKFNKNQLDHRVKLLKMQSVDDAPSQISNKEQMVTEEINLNKDVSSNNNHVEPESINQTSDVCSETDKSEHVINVDETASNEK